MSTERNLQVVSDYRYKEPINLDSALDVVDTVHLESNRQKQTYSFWVDKWGVVDQATGRYVHDIVTPESHSNPYLGLVEYSIIWQLDNWSTKETPDTSAWISTGLENEYGSNKIVIHEKVTTPAGQTEIKNTMLLFDCSSNEAFELTKNLFPEETENIQTTEELRSKLLVFKQKPDITKIIEAIEPHIPENKNYKPMTEEVRRYTAQLIVDGAPSYYVAQEMQRLGVLGEHDIGCVGGGEGYSGLLNESSLAINLTEGQGKYVKKCGNCGATIESVISSGYMCSQCGGVYKGC